MGTCFAKGRTGNQEEARLLPESFSNAGGENGAARAQDASRSEPKLQHPRCAALAKTLVEPWNNPYTPKLSARASFPETFPTNTETRVWDSARRSENPARPVTLNHPGATCPAMREAKQYPGALVNEALSATEPLNPQP